MAVNSPFQVKRYPELLGIVPVGGGGGRSLAEEVYDRILLRIIRRELPGGTELKSTVLAKELAVSRTPVNVALARLAADGIVKQAANLRATVSPGAENWLVDIHGMRMLVEPEAVRASAGRIPEAILGDMDLLMRDARPTSRGGNWREAARYFDYALHLVIAEYCGNLSMRETIRRCWSYKRISYEAGDDSDRALRAGYREHVAFLEALGAGKGEKAAKLVSEHLRSAGRLKAGQRIV